LRADTPVDDIAALIDHLGLDQPDLVGYSLGGGVALQLFATATIAFLDEQSS
jgi:pimeloyl-ACP methyl ester carboxylesterase